MLTLPLVNCCRFGARDRGSSSSSPEEVRSIMAGRGRLPLVVLELLGCPDGGPVDSRD